MSLICKDIVKTYSGRDVLQDVSLELQPGKIYGLIGRNGAGKTTLLSILAAQNPATRGSVTLDGAPVWENRRSLEKLCFSRELNANAESGLASMKAKEYLRIYANVTGQHAALLESPPETEAAPAEAAPKAEETAVPETPAETAPERRMIPIRTRLIWQILSPTPKTLTASASASTPRWTGWTALSLRPLSPPGRRSWKPL